MGIMRSDKWKMMQEDASKSKDEVTTQKREKKPRERISDRFSIKVLTFDKFKYKRNDIEGKTDIEKYKMALADTKNCKIREAHEYTKELNDFRPMERFVFTYIIILEKTQITK